MKILLNQFIKLITQKKTKKKHKIYYQNKYLLINQNDTKTILFLRKKLKVVDDLTNFVKAITMIAVLYSKKNYKLHKYFFNFEVILQNIKYFTTIFQLEVFHDFQEKLYVYQ